MTSSRPVNGSIPAPTAVGTPPLPLGTHSAPTQSGVVGMQSVTQSSVVVGVVGVPVVVGGVVVVVVGGVDVVVLGGLELVVDGSELVVGGVDTVVTVVGVLVLGSTIASPAAAVDAHTSRPASAAKVAMDRFTMFSPRCGVSLRMKPSPRDPVTHPRVLQEVGPRPSPAYRADAASCCSESSGQLTRPSSIRAISDIAWTRAAPAPTTCRTSSPAAVRTSETSQRWQRHGTASEQQITVRASRA